jgi:hypothetical protein
MGGVQNIASWMLIRWLLVVDDRNPGEMTEA